MFCVVTLASIDTNPIVFDQDMAITLRLRAQQHPHVLGLAVLADVIQGLLNDAQQLDFDTRR